MKRHEALLLSYFYQRRDELITCWEECRDAHPNLKYELDALFSSILKEVEESITLLTPDDIDDTFN